MSHNTPANATHKAHEAQAMRQQQAQGFQDTNGLFAQQIKARRASLNKVTTIVTHLPTVMTDQQDKSSTFEINNRKNTNHLSSEELSRTKKCLKPTVTKVTTACAFTNEPEAPHSQTPRQLKRLQVESIWQEAHGHLGKKHWMYPKMITECDADARPGYSTRKAHEYMDEDSVLLEKVKCLATMIKKSKNFLVYTGAGISTSSGIDDYASVAAESTIKKKTFVKPRSPLLAAPTFAHHAVTSLHNAGYVKRWVQQNHDGLPQKAGYPQEKLNEIHGAWFDPSNPVVPMSGSLRSDLFSDMLAWEQKCDLVLSMGTSMCGMNSDRVFTTCSKKALRNGNALGGVIVNLQCTQFDHLSALRIFAPIDTVMKLLLQQLKLQLPKPRVNGTSSASVQDYFYIPYNRHNGERSSISLSDQQQKICLDLREGARVRLTCGPYAGDVGEIVGKNRDGHYKIRFLHKLKPNKPLRMPFERLLGRWWTKTLCNGAVSRSPIVPV